jgi:hypothetical protein
MNRFFLCVAILSPCSVLGRRDSPSLYDISLLTIGYSNAFRIGLVR